jgi:hypothetical protein
MRTTAVGGVSSPKMGRNGNDDSNSDGGSGAPVTGHRHEEEGGERGCAHMTGEGENGGGGERARW